MPLGSRTAPRERSALSFLGLLAVLVPFGCGGDDGAGSAGGSTPCNPLVGASVPLEIGEVVAVGRAMDGKLYAIDRPPGSGELRVLESEGDLLFAREVAGVATANDGTVELTQVTVESAALGYTLLLEVEGSELRMARITGQNVVPPTIAETEPYERLEVVGPAVLDELTPRDIPMPLVILYLARVSNGALLMFVGPDDLSDGDLAGIHVFYGDDHELIERGELEIERQGDSDTTHIRFDLDGAVAFATFPPLDEATGEVPNATMQLRGEQLELQPIEDPSSHFESSSFLCL